MKSETCNYCQEPYKEWTPPSNLVKEHPDLGHGPVLIPSCDCLQKKNDKDFLKHIGDLKEEKALNTFKRLGLGGIDTIPEPYMKPPLDTEFIEWFEEEYQRGPAGNIILWGVPGTGKSAKLKAMAWQYIRYQHLSVRGGYISEIMQAFKDMDQVQELYHWYSNGKVLLLDDLDKALGTQYELEKILSLVEKYTSQKLPVWVTMSTPPEDFVKVQAKRARYGVDEMWFESLISRLKYNALVVEMNDKDFRAPAGRD